MRNRIFNLIVVAISTFIFLCFFLFSNGLNDLLSKLKTLNQMWIIIAVGCIIVFWILETLIIYVITKTVYNSKNIFVKLMRVSMIGQFFSAVTPFQSGMQPAQFFAMKEDGIPSGFAGSILMVKFIIHQTTLTLYSVVIMFTDYLFFKQNVRNFMYFCIFGFVFNTMIIIFALILSTNKELSDKLLRIIIIVLKKIRLVKDMNISYKKFQSELNRFHDSINFIAAHFEVCVSAIVLTILQWTFYYTIPYCIYRSFGFNNYDLWTMICAQVFLTLFMSFIPLPGAALGAESGFYIIYGLFFKNNTLVPALFLWRLITYYFTIGVGSIFTVMMCRNSNCKEILVKS